MFSIFYEFFCCRLLGVLSFHWQKLGSPVPGIWRLVSDHTVKKGWRFSRPQPRCHLPNSPWAGKIKLFPLRESLVSDIPDGDGKTTNPFLQCRAPFIKIYSTVQYSSYIL
jgi:hypothetical protein